MTNSGKYDDRGYIVTEIVNSDIEIKGQKYVMFNGIALDRHPLDMYDPHEALGEGTLKVGDIVNMDSNGLHRKKRYTDCEHAIVTGANIVQYHSLNKTGTMFNIITAFCAKYGDIMIELPSPYFGTNVPNWYIGTQRGDEILVRKCNKSEEEPGYEIVTNLTINKLRTDFLIRNR